MGMMERFRNSEQRRVVVIGVDGLPFSLIDAHPDRFEHFHALMETGDGGPLTSIVPTASSVTWPSLVTGRNPGETGVYGLLDRHIHTYETYITAADDVQAIPVWDRVAEAGRRASVINAPVTYPPQRNLTRMVADYQAPDLDRAVYPRSVADELRPLDYRLDVDATLGQRDSGAFLEDAYETIDARYEAIAHFLERDDWDLFVGVFTTPDRVNHFLYGDYLEDGPHRDDFLAFYEQLDTYLGAIRSHLPDEATLLVVSEHGFVPLEFEVQVNAWLEANGWLSYQTAEPERLSHITDETRAFSLDPGRIYLNLKEREPRGSVSQEEYEIVRDRLRDSLMTWTGPDGQPVAREVITREERFRGKHVDLAPDLVIIPHDGFDLHARFTAQDAAFHRSARTGMHRETDAFIGTDQTDANLDQATIYDLAPTILDLLGLTVEPAEFDGRSLFQPSVTG